MEKNLTLKTSVVIRASLSNVWKALTDPVQIKQYFFGTDAVSDWKVGSPLLFKGVWDGKEYEDKGIILELEEDKKLTYNYWSAFSGTEDRPENYAIITYELLPEGENTVYTVYQTGFTSEEQIAHSKNNWQVVMKNLKEMLED